MVLSPSHVAGTPVSLLSMYQWENLEKGLENLTNSGAAVTVGCLYEANMVSCCLGT